MRIYKASPAFNSGNSVLRTGAHGNSANSTITRSINSSGNHRHTINAAGNHAHSMNNTGGGKAHNIMQPTLFVNMAMKYADASALPPTQTSSATESE